MERKIDLRLSAMLNNNSSLKSLGSNNSAGKCHIRKSLVPVAVCLCLVIVLIVLLANHQLSKFSASDDGCGDGVAVVATGRPGDFCAMNKKDGEGYVSANKATATDTPFLDRLLGEGYVSANTANTDFPVNDAADPGNENKSRIIWRFPCDVYDCADANHSYLRIFKIVT